ncbi:MAG: ABC transporter permease subunit [Actinomycetota bacterium]
MARSGVRPSTGAVIALVPVAFLVVFVVWPLVAVGVRSLAGVAPERVLEVAFRSTTRSVVGFTLLQAALSTIVTLVVGLPVAQVLARYRFWGRRVVRVVAVVPFVMPTVVVAGAFIRVFDRVGVVEARSLVAIVAAHVFFNVAVVVRVVGGYWADTDRRLEDSARMLGAGPWAVFRWVTLPRLGPALAAATTLVFLFSFTSFGVIRLLGGPARATLETEIFRYAVRRIEFDVAAVLALIQLIAVAALAVISGALQRRVAFVQQGRRRSLARPAITWAERVHVGAALLLIAAVVVVPMAAMVEGSFAVGDGYGLDHYQRLFTRGDLLPVSAGRALLVSLGFAALAAAMAVVVGVAAAVTVVRGGRVGRTLEALTLVPLGVSAVTLGFGYLLAFSLFELRRSIWVVPLAHAVIGLPFVLAAVVPTMRSLDPRLAQAAAVLGARPRTAALTVTWPLIRPAVATGAGFAAAVSIGEFGATSFLARGASSFTAPLAIFRLLSQPGEALRGQALALSVVLGLLVATLTAIIEWRRADGATLL